MSDFFVMLVLKTVIYYSKLLGFQNFACLKLEHYESDSDFMDKHYLELRRITKDSKPETLLSNNSYFGSSVLSSSVFGIV